MKVTIQPGSAGGQVRVPASKSAAHRLLISAGLAQGVSKVSNVELSKDIEATLNCLAALGVSWSYEDGTVTLDGSSCRVGKGSVKIENANGIVDANGVVDANGAMDANGAVDAEVPVLPCNECGSTLRFFVPLCLLQAAPCRLTGSAKLLSRPMQVYEKLCAEQGLSMEIKEDGIWTKGPLESGSYEIAGDISSQFITGLLFALPLLPGDSELKVTEPFESRPYVDLTLQALSLYGITVEELPGNRFHIPGNQAYQPKDTVVEGDWSNAAFLYALEELNQVYGQGATRLTVTGADLDSLQGDKVCLDYYKALREGYCTLDLTDCPDLAPIMFAMAGVLHGAYFTGTRRLAFKESDRVRAMQEELIKLGIDIEQEENAVRVIPADIKGLPLKPAAPIDGHNDHRIVMAMATLLTLTGGEIEGAQAVTKSYPDYFERIGELGIMLTKE